MVFDAWLVAVIVDGTAVTDRAGCINKDGLWSHGRAESTCEFAGCILHDEERMVCLGDVVFHLVFGIVFVGVDCDEGGVGLAANSA